MKLFKKFMILSAAITSIAGTVHAGDVCNSESACRNLRNKAQAQMQLFQYGADCLKGEILAGHKISPFVEVRENKNGNFIHDELTAATSPDETITFLGGEAIVIASLNWKSVYLVDYSKIDDDSGLLDRAQLVRVTRETLDAIGCKSVAIPDWLKAD